ncbi:MAG: hypothetical protein DRP64_02930 [Verrucomicrobia bacterium]|nr:MAG: hypothetical protein DRP64_02930 [Verrucomicrobiota bacterium]
MDKEVVLNKLENLRRCVARVEAKRPSSLTELTDDIDRQDIIVLNLERSVQACVDIGMHLLTDFSEITMPDSMSGTFKTLASVKIIDAELSVHLSKAVGFRNTAVHAYQDMDWAIVYSIIHERLDDFRDYARSVVNYMDRLD